MGKSFGRGKVIRAQSEDFTGFFFEGFAVFAV
jgi:hypothetical protein